MQKNSNIYMMLTLISHNSPWSVFTLYSRFTVNNLFFLATKSPLEHVHSQGKVLGDRRVLYKYLNPNLIAVGTEVTPDTKPGISIYLIDAVTGTTIFNEIKFLIVSQNRNKKNLKRFLNRKFWYKRGLARPFSPSVVNQLSERKQLTNNMCLFLRP